MNDYDDIVTSIDQLYGDAIQVFGPYSLTAAACKALYDLACKEALVLGQEPHEKSDEEEFRAAFAAQQAREAAAMNKER